jgi:invasion protein IalB
LLARQHEVEIMTVGSGFGERTSRRLGRSLLLAALGLGWAAAAVLAPVGVARADTPTPQDTVYKAWTLSCLTPQAAEGATTKPKQICRVFHQVHGQADATKILLVAAARYIGAERTPVINVTLPPAANLQRGLSFQVDESEMFKANIQVCTNKLCLAQFKLTDDLMKLFRTGKAVSFSFAVNPQGEAKYSIPLSGFAPAMDALQKTGS